MMYLTVSTVIVAVCLVLATKVMACIKAERLEQRGRIALEEPPRVAASGRRAGGSADARDPRSPGAPGILRGVAGSRRPGAAKSDTPFARRLRAAGVALAPVWFMALLAVGALTAGAVAAAASGSAPFGLVAAGAVCVVAHLQINRSVRMRRELLDVQLAHALPRIAASLRGSLTLERALRVALVHMDDPLRGEIARVLADATYGMPLHEALDAMARRTQSADVKTLASAAKMRKGSGGSVAAALAMIATRVNSRLKAARELRVEVAGTRMAKWFVAGSMPVIFLIMYATNADFARFYETEPLGWTVLGVAIALEVVGLVAAHAVTSFDRQ